MSRNFSGTTNLVRSDSVGAGFGDFALTAGPFGQLALLWQGMSREGSDTHYAIYDVSSSTWSLDIQLFHDAAVERSVAPVWDARGNLTIAYTKVGLTRTNKTLTLSNNSTVTVTNVPQPGRVDLLVTKHRLIQDLALLPGDLAVVVTNWLPYSRATVSATLRNLGDLPATNVTVSFWDGDPAASGILITNRAVPGWLAGGATNLVSVSWAVSESSSNHMVFAMIDPGDLVRESNETNNLQSLALDEPGLEVSLIRYRSETNGALRVIAQVKNGRGAAAARSVLAIRRAGETNAPLATAVIPGLAGGQLAQVALDLPPGTQPEGESVYTLFADDTFQNPALNRTRSSATFAVFRWLDSDGDEIPDAWMTQHFGHPAGQPADRSRADDDPDADGISNLGEYHAGTDPRDGNSYFRIRAITVAGGSGNAVELSWGSPPNKLYTVERSTNATGGFADLEQHIISTPPETIYMDTTATGGREYFYRLRLE